MSAEYELELDISNVCRVCLLAKEKLTNIYTNILVEGNILSLPVMIRNCLELKICEVNTDFPRKICDQCKIQVINFYSFKEKSKRAEEALEKVLQKSFNVKQEEAEPPNPEVDNSNALEPAFVVEAETDGFLAEIEVQNEEHMEYEELEETHIKSADTEVVYEDDSKAEIVTAKTELELDLSTEEDKQIISEEEPDEVAPVEHIEIMSYPQDPSDVNVCGVCGRSFETSNNLDRHMECHMGVYYKCRICPRMYNHQASRNRHMREVHPDEMQELAMLKENPFKRNDPKNLPQYFPPDSSKGSLVAPENSIPISVVAVSDVLEEQEIKSYDEEVEDENETTLDFPVPESESPSEPSEFCCFYCHKIFKQRSKLVVHLKQHENRSIVSEYLHYFTCSKCNTMFLTEDELKRHVEEVHTKDKEQFVDDQCTDYQFLEEDKTSNCPEDVYKCGVCKVTKVSEVEMKRHLISHAERVNCPFEGCGCEYSSFSRLNIHIINKHLQKGEYKCLHCCEVSFETYDELRNHMKKDCKERKFECSHCSKKFLSKKSLHNHQKTFMEKKFMCQFCGKSFAQGGELTIHNRTHTGERPFQCTICNKTYKTSSMRASHMDTHIEGKTFSCTICNKKLQTRTCYRNHMKRHTVEKQYQCMSCTKKFHSKYHLTLHTSRIHKKVVQPATKEASFVEQSVKVTTSS